MQQTSHEHDGQHGSTGGSTGGSTRALLHQLGVAARHHQRSLDSFDQALVDAFAINRTDGRCVDVVHERGPLTAGELARACGLTTGAATAVIDRLERAGLVRRRADPADRRKVIVEVTREAEARLAEIFVPLASEGADDLAHFSDEQLATVIEYLEVDRALHDRHGEALRRAPRSTR
jgi:DNA-binding MarR family transcriptional regulator